MDAVRRILGAIAGIGLALAAPTAALAHHPADGADASLVRVEPRIGPPLLTHGRDPRPEPAETRRATHGLPPGVGFEPGDARRPPACVGDHYTQVLYGRPASSPNRAAAVRDSIRAVVERTNAVLNAESLASGGGTADYRVRCDANSTIAVGEFVSSGSGFGQIVSAARAAGYNAKRVNYLIFFDHVTADTCGIASFEDDQSLAPDNLNNEGGGYAVAYEDCWQSEIPMHESGHTMGAVQYGAPHSTGSGSHCYEDNDVMCYSPDGGDRNQDGTVQVCGGTPRFDCGFDDYFDAAPEPGEYLARHWNLGSRLNRFIAFGDGGPGLIDTIGGAVSSLLGGGRKNGSGEGVAGGPGEWRLYKLEVTRPARALRVRLEHPLNAPLTLYVRRLKEPTAGQFTCRKDGSGTKSTCRIARPKRGRWYAGIASSGTAGTPFRIRATLVNPRR